MTQKPKKKSEKSVLHFDLYNFQDFIFIVISAQISDSWLSKIFTPAKKPNLSFLEKI